MDPATTMPPSLEAAMAMEPIWLRTWIMLLIATHLVAVLFVVRRSERSGLSMRVEPVAIVVSFFLAAIFMGWLYDQVGYVRLLGLAHVVFWGPVYVWVWSRRRTLFADGLFGKYVYLYLGVAGVSLVIDLIDVVRFLVGDGDLLGRWA